MSGFLVFAGTAGIVVGLIAALKWSLPRFHLASRKQCCADGCKLQRGDDRWAIAEPLPEDPSEAEATSSPSANDRAAPEFGDQSAPVESNDQSVGLIDQLGCPRLLGS